MVFDPNSVSFHTVPMVAPGNVQVHVINSTLAKVHWDPVPLKSVRGHLQGYKVSTIKSLLFSFVEIDHSCKVRLYLVCSNLICKRILAFKRAHKFG